MPDLDKTAPSPFHAGEQEMQRRAGRRDRAEAIGRRMIRPFLPGQHQDFYAQLPFLVAGALDAEGWPWASLLTGDPGFARSPDPQHLQVALPGPDPADPVQAAIRRGAALGLLGIELSTRRRNRVNGRVQAADGGGFTLRVDQTFGNCPQYIQTHALAPSPRPRPLPAPQSFTRLSDAHQALIATAAMFHVASHAPAQPGDGPHSTGSCDVSHRGGRPGFVRTCGSTLTIPDFAGNNHFNTLGNFLLYPRAGLVFADFASGSLLHLTGTVTLLEPSDPVIASFEGAQRGWRFTLHHGLWRPGVLPFRAAAGEVSPRTLATGSWPEQRGTTS